MPRMVHTTEAANRAKAQLMKGLGLPLLVEPPLTRDLSYNAIGIRALMIRLTHYISGMVVDSPPVIEQMYVEFVPSYIPNE
jgi:hypothetical protein